MYRITEETEFAGLPRGMNMAANRVIFIDEENVMFIRGRKTARGEADMNINLIIPYVLYFDESKAIEQESVKASIKTKGEKYNADLSNLKEVEKNYNQDGSEQKKEKLNAAKAQLENSKSDYEQEVKKLDSGSMRHEEIELSYDNYEDFNTAMGDLYATLATHEKFKELTLTRI